MENQLIVMGLNGLSDGAMIEQLGRMVVDGGMLAGLLNECDQDKRREMYEAIRPHLRFKPLPLEDYLNFFKERADAIASYSNPVVVGDQKFREVSADDAEGCVVKLTCHKCTFQQSFVGRTPVETVMQARAVGWVRDVVKQKEICPKCPAIMPHERVNHA